MPRTFKAELTIPVEQYGNIKPIIEGTAQDIVDAYYEFSKMVKPQVGLSTKQFNDALDTYLNDGTGNTEVYMAMSLPQKEVFQHLKRAFKRIEAKGHTQVGGAQGD